MDPLWFDDKIKIILNVKNNKRSWNMQLRHWVNVKERSDQFIKAHFRKTF